MWLLVVHLETQLEASVAEPALAAQQTCSWHQLLLCQIPAGTVGKPCGVLGSSGSHGAEDCGQLLPAQWLCSVPLLMARGSTTHLAH